MIEPEIKENDVSEWQRSRRIPEYEDLNKILDNSQTVNHFLRKLNRPENKRNVLRLFLWWLKTARPDLYDLGPDGILRYQKTLRRTCNGFEIVGLLEDWVNEKGGRVNTMKTYRSIIRSFFMHNRAELPQDKTARLKTTRYSPVTRFEIKEIRSIYSAASPLIRAVMMFAIMGGMGCDEILYWSETGTIHLSNNSKTTHP